MCCLKFFHPCFGKRSEISGNRSSIYHRIKAKDFLQYAHISSGRRICRFSGETVGYGAARYISWHRSRTRHSRRNWRRHDPRNGNRSGYRGRRHIAERINRGNSIPVRKSGLYGGIRVRRSAGNCHQRQTVAVNLISPHRNVVGGCVPY